MPRIVRTLTAGKDLRDIWLYVAQDSPEAADRLLDRIDDSMRTLAVSPHMGEQQEELGAGLRRFVVGNYLIFYRPLEDGIEAIRILHGACRWEDQF